MRRSFDTLVDARCGLTTIHGTPRSATGRLKLVFSFATATCPRLAVQCGGGTIRFTVGSLHVELPPGGQVVSRGRGLEQPNWDGGWPLAQDVSGMDLQRVRPHDPPQLLQLFRIHEAESASGGVARIDVVVVGAARSGSAHRLRTRTPPGPLDCACRRKPPPPLGPGQGRRRGV